MNIARLGLRIYRWFISPLIHTLAGPGMGCRFQPSCGEYAEEAFRKHSMVRATRLTAGRLARCQPLCEGGWDPVP